MLSRLSLLAAALAVGRASAQGLDYCFAEDGPADGLPGCGARGGGGGGACGAGPPARGDAVLYCAQLGGGGGGACGAGPPASGDAVLSYAQLGVSNVRRRPRVDAAVQPPELHAAPAQLVLRAAGRHGRLPGTGGARPRPRRGPQFRLQGRDDLPHVPLLRLGPGQLVRRGRGGLGRQSGDGVRIALSSRVSLLPGSLLPGAGRRRGLP